MRTTATGHAADRADFGTDSNATCLRRGRRDRLIGILATICTVGISAHVHAQSRSRDKPSAALFTTAGRDFRARELDTKIRKALESQGDVRLTAALGMDLGAMQLAMDCVEESVKCLRAVATQNHVDVLVAPALERADGELTLTLLSFDARGTGTLNRVVRWQSGEVLTAATLESVPELVSGLFATASHAPNPTPTPLVAEPEVSPPAARDQALASDSSPARNVPLAPLVVIGSGAIVLGAGVVAGIMMRGTESEYASMHIRTRSDAEAAYESHDVATTQATVANVLYGLGGVAIAAGGVWLAIELLGNDREPRERGSLNQLLPTISPGQLGVQYRGGWL
jgi:hypothetical protein